ncbi:hypothetical protein KOR42_28610 [Thalassoglobus neptunius]|uniref:Uncharacterized protein n=1 Tax=Thalassoglobus neptunius TaxID=1938619 RepID=A0A5C5WZZ6_9PLAN|nr:hypothetical protein KOR42_28610 [Thalassoglobus neptunius]
MSEPLLPKTIPHLNSWKMGMTFFLESTRTLSETSHIVSDESQYPQWIGRHHDNGRES